MAESLWVSVRVYTCLWVYMGVFPKIFENFRIALWVIYGKIS